MSGCCQVLGDLFVGPPRFGERQDCRLDLAVVTQLLEAADRNRHSELGHIPSAPDDAECDFVVVPLQDDFLDQAAEQHLLLRPGQERFVPELWKPRPQVFEHLQQVRRDGPALAFLTTNFQVVFGSLKFAQSGFPASFQLRRYLSVLFSGDSEPPPACGDLPLLDTFDDTSGTELVDHLMNRGCGWVVSVGTSSNGTIQGNLLNISGTPIGWHTETTSHIHKITTDINLGTAATQIELSCKVRFIDQNNFWRSALRITAIGTYTIEIWDRVAGASTQRVSNALSSGGGFGLAYSFSAETDGTHIAAAVTGGGIGSATYTTLLFNGAKRVGFQHNVTGSYTSQSNYTRCSVT